MKRLLSVALLVVAGAAVGCQKQNKPTMTEVPPPPMESDVQPQPFEPVQVQPAVPAPAAPAPVAAQPAPQPAPAPAYQTYTVQKGDTLWKIAQRQYGDGQRWVDIVQANPGLEPTKMAVGQQIILP